MGNVFERLQPEGWPRPKGYSNGYRIPAGHDLVVTAGMVGWDAREQIVPGGLVPQFEQALRNVLAVVRLAGGGPEHVVRLTAYVADRDEYLASLAGLGEAWKRVMGRSYPAMALVQVAGFVEDGALVEIEGTAHDGLVAEQRVRVPLGIDQQAIGERPGSGVRHRPPTPGRRRHGGPDGDARRGAGTADVTRQAETASATESSLPTKTCLRA